MISFWSETLPNEKIMRQNFSEQLVVVYNDGGGLVTDWGDLMAEEQLDQVKLWSYLPKLDGQQLLSPSEINQMTNLVSQDTNRLKQTANNKILSATERKNASTN